MNNISLFALQFLSALLGCWAGNRIAEYFYDRRRDKILSQYADEITKRFELIHSAGKDGQSGQVK